MEFDFNPPSNSPLPPARNRSRLAIGLILAVLLAVGGTLLLREQISSMEALTAPAEITAAPPRIPVPQSRVVEGSIRPGDTINGLLNDYFSPQQLHELANASRKVFPLSNICAGQPFKLCLTGNAFERFEYDIDREAQLIIAASGSGFDVKKVPIAYTVKTEQVRGTIQSSLFETVAEIGESPELAIALADIFAWDIDFLRDIRVGDSFEALVEKRYREGQPAGYGKLLAAKFVNQGDRYSAFLYRDGSRPPAYFDARGNGLRKAFLRAPLAFSRISSGFTMHRFHPITKTWKAHPAIDYAAPVGTPIMAIGDGTILKREYSQFNGNYVKLRHANGIESIYLHMSRFAAKLRPGKRVTQGQTIGYVGSTGLATGPHLCFRMTKNGGPINPNKLKSTTAAPVSTANLADFKATVAALSDRLEGRQTVAEAFGAKPRN